MLRPSLRWSKAAGVIMDEQAIAAALTLSDEDLALLEVDVAPALDALLRELERDLGLLMGSDLPE